jgi:hypothetical protein
MVDGAGGGGESLEVAVEVSRRRSSNEKERCGASQMKCKLIRPVRCTLAALYSAYKVGAISLFSSKLNIPG